MKRSVQISECQEGDPVWITGLKNVLEAGSTLCAVSDEKSARELLATQEQQVEAAKVQEEKEEQDQEDIALLSQLIKSNQQDEDIKYVNIVLKSDTNGTLEAIKSELKKLDDNEVKVKIIAQGTGLINEEDIYKAKIAKGIVIGFQVPLNRRVEDISRKEKVLVKNYEIIYDLIDEISDVMESLVEPEVVEEEVARARVKKIFVLSNGQSVAGCEVISGNVVKGYKVYVERGSRRIGSGRITSLKQLKQEVKESKKGQDCGILIEPPVAVEQDDEIVCVKVEKA